MTEDRIRGIESTWKLARSGRVTPPAMIALEQVKELIAEVRKLQGDALVLQVSQLAQQCLEVTTERDEAVRRFNALAVDAENMARVRDRLLAACKVALVQFARIEGGRRYLREDSETVKGLAAAIAYAKESK